MIFQLCTVTYGLAPAAYLAIRSLMQLAYDHKEDHPTAFEVVLHDMYSDNVLAGAHTKEEAAGKVRELLSLFRKGNMNLRKWSSNDPSSLSNLPPEMLVTDRVNLFAQDTAVPILGIAWHTKDDCYRFHLETVVLEFPITKRTILSRIAHLFDPLGWLGPAIIQAKILLQSLWLLKLDWDEPLSQDKIAKWTVWIKDLPSVSEIAISRWTGYSPSTRAVELHGFADASKLAFGAVLYLRLVGDNGVSVSLQSAKTKVAPVKTLSIPRLEPSAALIFVRIVKVFLESITLTVRSVHLWTDSADVLFWLKDHPSRWNVFVANRCSEIYTTVPNAFWHHVKTKENPADVLSRGIQPSELKDHALWCHGPPFLMNTETN